MEKDQPRKLDGVHEEIENDDALNNDGTLQA